MAKEAKETYYLIPSKVRNNHVSKREGAAGKPGALLIFPKPKAIRENKEDKTLFYFHENRKYRPPMDRKTGKFAAWEYDVASESFTEPAMSNKLSNKLLARRAELEDQAELFGHLIPSGTSSTK